MLYLEGNEEEASKVHDRLRKINPEDSDSWILKGAGLAIFRGGYSTKAEDHDQLIEELSNAYQDAIECFNRAIELDRTMQRHGL